MRTTLLMSSVSMALACDCQARSPGLATAAVFRYGRFPMPRKKKTEAPADATSTTPGPVPEKRQTVEAIGLDRPTREIIAAAAEHGVKVSRTYVELLKKRARGDAPAAKPAKAPKATKATKPAKRAAPAKKAATAAPRGRKAESAAPGGGADAAFRAAAVEVVLEVGAARARELLEDVVQAIRWAAGALAPVHRRKRKRKGGRLATRRPSFVRTVR